MALPNYRIEVRKELVTETWSNDYLVNAASFDECDAIAVALCNFEKTLYPTTVSIVWYRSSTMVVGDRTFRHVGVNLAGTRAVTQITMMPLFCTLRVDLTCQDTDPCRKYYRAVLLEADCEFHNIIPASITNYQNLINTGLVNSVALDNIVSGKGNVVVGATVHGKVQMRQLKRRNKPKEPVVP